MTEIIARLHIVLADTDPLIWRRVDVPVDANLKMLHDVIQGAMGWLDYHLWEFEADDKRYGLPDPDWDDDTLFAAKNIKLKALLERGVRRLLYTYDMGTIGNMLSPSRRWRPASRPPNIRDMSMASDALLPRMSAEHPVSKPFSTPSPNPGAATIRKPSNGTAVATEKISTPSGSTNSPPNSE